MIKVTRKEVKNPSVEIEFPITIKQHLDSVKLARIEFGENYTDSQFIICKIIVCCKFDGEIRNLSYVESLSESLITKIGQAMNEEHERVNKETETGN